MRFILFTLSQICLIFGFVNVAAPETLDSDTVTAGGAATVETRIRREAHDVESSKVATFYECSHGGCEAVAVRGDFCVEHTLICRTCRGFVGPAELQDGECQAYRKSDCAFDVEHYVGARCRCGFHREGRS